MKLKVTKKPELEAKAQQQAAAKAKRDDLRDKAKRFNHLTRPEKDELLFELVQRFLGNDE
jgi:hypothetical protein